MLGATDYLHVCRVKEFLFAKFFMQSNTSARNAEFSFVSSLKWKGGRGWEEVFLVAINTLINTLLFFQMDW